MRTLLALLVGCSSATPAPAPLATAAPAKPAPAEAKPAEPEPDPAPVALEGTRPCKPGSADHEEAKQRFAALDKQIKSLKPADNHHPANRALIELLEHPCFAMIEIGESELEAEAAPALVDFWKSGGAYWLENTLNLGGEFPWASAPPKLRKVISAETRPAFAAHSMLCSLADPSCSAGAAGWWQRAETAFVAAGKARERLDDACKTKALARPPAERFVAFARCVHDRREVRPGMPLGGIKVPTSGWLIVRGRRGHYSFCDEVRLYSLATGAGYVSQSCAGLFVVEGDKVRNGTAADRKPQFRRGSMPVANVRELAWMLLQLGDVVPKYHRGRSLSLPEGIEVVKGHGSLAPTHREVMVKGSDQTTLAWALADKKRVLISGTIIWPADYNNGPANHALDLMRTAEGGFVDGCPRERPPKLSSLGRAKPAVSPIDADADELGKLEGALVDQIDKGARTRCKGRRRR